MSECQTLVLVPNTREVARMTEDGKSTTDDVKSMMSFTGVENKLMPLPAGWPKIAQLQDKKSWDYSTTISPSINKATSHLELLQTVIEDWQNDMRSQAVSRLSTVKGKQRLAITSTPASRKQMHFQTQNVVESGGKSVSSLSDHPNLAVEGLGAMSEIESTHKAVEIVAYDELQRPYLGAEDVVDEVITLLAKLEVDRTETLKTLCSERDRVTQLKSRIDTLSMQRLMYLPVAVQKEHEACAMDISELNWHVSYRGRIKERNGSKTATAETLNQRLKEDIAFVQKHIPLVMEKLELELEAMERIKCAQDDTNEELDITLQRCNKVEAKSGEANSKAEEERANLKRDLDSVRSELTRISDELAEAKMTHNTYIHQCNDYRQTLIDNDQELKVLLVRDENVQAAEAMQAIKVRELETQIKQREFEHRILEDENIKLQFKLDSNKKRYTKKERDMRESIYQKEESLRQLNRQNDELKMDLEDLGNKLKGCDKQKIADEKNLERMERELERTEEQINMTKDDLGDVSIINNAVREQLQNDEEKCLQAEEALRSTTEALKKQVKEEMHTRTVLTARIQSDSSDLVKTQAEVKVKRDMIDRKVTEVENAVSNILGKVEKLRSYSKEKTNLISNMKQQLQDIAENKRQIGETCQNNKRELAPQHKKSKEAWTVVEKKMDHMEWKTDMMNKKIKEMNESSTMFIKAINKTTTIIVDLETNLNELNIQITTGQKMENGLRTHFEQVTGRVEIQDKQHKDFMKARNNVLEEHETGLKDHLVWNKDMAAHYRHLQNEYVTLKNKMLDMYENKIKLENAIKDTKQLQGLQKRMHSALTEYLKYRGLFNKGELQRMEVESHGNAVKVLGLQGQMDTALSEMTDFLQHQMDGDTIRKMAMDKVSAEDVVPKPPRFEGMRGTPVVPPIKVPMGQATVVS